MNRSAKKIVGLALAATMLLSLVGCGGTEKEADTTAVAATEPEYTLVEPGKLTIGSDLDYPPFEMLNADGKPEAVRRFEAHVRTPPADDEEEPAINAGRRGGRAEPTPLPTEAAEWDKNEWAKGWAANSASGTITDISAVALTVCAAPGRCRPSST